MLTQILLKLAHFWTNFRKSHSCQRWHWPRKFCSIFLLSSLKNIQISQKVSFVFPNTSGAILKTLHNTNVRDVMHLWGNTTILCHTSHETGYQRYCQTFEIQGLWRSSSEQDQPLSPITVQEHSSLPAWQGICKKTTNKQVTMDWIYIKQ